MRKIINLLAWSAIALYLWKANNIERISALALVFSAWAAMGVWQLVEAMDSLKDQIRHIKENTGALLNQPPPSPED